MFWTLKKKKVISWWSSSYDEKRSDQWEKFFEICKGEFNQSYEGWVFGGGGWPMQCSVQSETGL